MVALKTCIFVNLPSCSSQMEQIFRVNGTVLLIGIARMAAVLVRGRELLSVDVLEADNNDSKRR